jgi:fluoride ion exporter CrcB/FEX
MDLTIPYTFYPVALPDCMAWALFLLAIVGGAAAGVARGRVQGWMSCLRTGLLGALGLLIVTMVASMVIAFFVHDV